MIWTNPNVEVMIWSSYRLWKVPIGIGIAEFLKLTGLMSLLNKTTINNIVSF